MAAIYVSSSTGNDTYGTGTEADPVKTIAQAIILSATTICLFEDYFNEDCTGASQSITGIGNNKTVCDGDGLASSFFINVNVKTYSKLYIKNGIAFTRQNQSTLTDCRIEDCAFFTGASADFDGFGNGMTGNLFINITDTQQSFKSGVGNYQYNTYYNAPIDIRIDSGVALLLKHQIIVDTTIRLRVVQYMYYSLIYGNCQVWDNISAFVDVTDLATLELYGTFTGCQVLPNITGAVADNGSGNCRVTKATHGLVNNQEITIRVGNDNYLTPRVAITYIDANTFDIDTIPFISGYSSIEYNEPLFVNEFEKNFNVWTDSRACRMNATDAYTPIGAGQMVIPYQLDEFQTLTNITETDEAGYTTMEINNTASNGVLASGNIVLFDEPVNINGLGSSEITEYANGSYLSATPQLTETTYAAGVTLPSEYVKVEVGAVVYGGNTYDVDDVFLAAGGTFTTGASGIVREFNPGQEQRQATVSVRLKHGDTWSDDLLIILGTTGAIVNYQDDDPGTQKITYGNGDSAYDSGNEFGLYAITGIEFLTNTLQNGDRSAVV